ncbi:MAG: myo-inositol-1-phosphate synthase [archaeon GB-1845-036]|nr:myo-inositol-1-phosphate synthase [Candidatus Culexmicrobium thermophilum]HDO20544.1 myo-inositol-1-phosphate synthase [Candidatus Bathyarchaeota archaeon]
MIKTVLLGQGMVADHLAVGIERIKMGELEPYGIPLANKNLKYSIEDIEIVGSYDVNVEKIGRTIYDVAERELESRINIPLKLKDIEVLRGLHLGSLRGLKVNAEGLEEKKSLREAINELVDQWRKMKPDVIINVITTEYGEPFRDLKLLENAVKKEDAERLTASQVYAYALSKYSEETGRRAAFINVIPTPLANDEAIVKLYEKKKLIILGDDGATGATPLTSDLLEHLAERNRKVEFIIQFNIGGNMDFLALTIPKKNLMKEATKSSIVKDVLGYDTPHYIKPTGFLKPLGDRKFVSLHMEYRTFNNLKDEIYVNLRMNDSPALAGNLVDLIRLAKIALDKHACGTIYPINAFFMKKPGPKGSKSISKIIAYQKLLEWIETMRD